MSANYPVEDKRFKELANTLYSSLSSLITVTDSWAYFFFHSPFIEAKDLQAKIRTIYIAALFDTVEAEQRKLPKAIEEAVKLGFPILAENGNEIKKIIANMGSLIEPLSQNEQIFILNMRNQFVHGYVTAGIEDPVNIKFVQNGEIQKKPISVEEYRQIIRSFFENGMSLDDTINGLLAPLFDLKSQYWRYMAYTQQIHRKIYQTILENEIIKINI